MGIVWEAYHKGVTLLVVPETPTDTIHPPKITAEIEKNKRRTAGVAVAARFLLNVAKVLLEGFFVCFLFRANCRKTERFPKIPTKTFKTAEPLSARTSDTQLLTKTGTQATDFKQRRDTNGGRVGPRPLEGRLPGDVIHNDSCRGISNVTRDEAAESFLPKIPGICAWKTPVESRFLGLKNLKPPQKKNRSCIGIVLQLYHLH